MSAKIDDKPVTTIYSIYFSNEGGGVFAACENMKSVVLPDSLTFIGHGASYDCDTLTTINYS